MIQTNYNPDVLSCLANLSNDEVFTPPALANDILDLLPKELWSDPSITFLDPVSKSGVFLREIAKRLMLGLEAKIPDKQTRINHIFSKQIFGIAITEMTSLLSRRSVYCSKTANGKYSICETFKDPIGNIQHAKINHTWKDKKCKYCGASQDVYDREDTLETYAYNFIHTDSPEKIFNMKFDVIIGNPPYQLSDGGGMKSGTSSGSAIPLYHKFIQQAKKLNPKYLTMIIPARWYSGGRGLDLFRDEILKDKKIKYLVDFEDSRECFPGVDIAGGVCYFLWDNNYNDLCNYTSHSSKGVSSKKRILDEHDVFIRDNISLEIINKVKNEKAMSEIVYSSNPFGFRSFFVGKSNQRGLINPVSILTSKGVNYVEKKEVTSNSELIDKWKVILSKASAEHAGQTDKEGRKKIFSKVELLKPNEICSESYLLVGVFDSKENAENLQEYIKSKFFRFLVSSVLLTQNIAKDKFCFVPIQDFKVNWDDEKLYKKYNLTKSEIDFIESMIRPMNTNLNNVDDE
jgi:site-specific DNA-methyltransferase (adenine-specific)